jgi:putative tryptophan/tyrosine transport system substrate-binding protein
MRRRQFITLIGSAAAWPLAVSAQQRERMRRIGVLLRVAQDDPDAQLDLQAFREGLQAAGWVAGHNIEVNYRYAGADPDGTTGEEFIRTAPVVGIPKKVPRKPAGALNAPPLTRTA